MIQKNLQPTNTLSLTSAEGYKFTPPFKNVMIFNKGTASIYIDVTKEVAIGAETVIEITGGTSYSFSVNGNFFVAVTGNTTAVISSSEGAFNSINYALAGSGGGGGDGVSQQYVDDQDAAILVSAKTYTDTKTAETLTAAEEYSDDHYNSLSEQLQNKTSTQDSFKAAAKGVTDYYTWIDASPPTKIIYVDADVPVHPTSNMDGSILFPFDQVQSGIDATDSGDSEVVRIGAGTYLDIEVNNKTNTTIEGTGTVIGSYGTSCEDLTISGNSTRIRVKDIEFTGAFNYQSTLGLCYFTNCSFKDMTFTSTNSGGYIRFDNCFFDNVTFSSGGAFVDMYNCQQENGGITTLESTFGGTVGMANCNNIALQHDAGLFVSRGDTNYVQLDSTASTANGRLLLLGGTMFNGTSYIPIKKTGNCAYCVTLFIHEPQIDEIDLSQKIDSGLHTEDIYCHYLPQTYAPLGNDVTAFMRAIDVEFVSQRAVTSNVTKYAIVKSAYNGTYAGVDLGQQLTIEQTNTTVDFGAVGSNLSIGRAGTYEVNVTIGVINTDTTTENPNIGSSIEFGGTTYTEFDQTIATATASSSPRMVINMRAIIVAATTGDIGINCYTNSTGANVNYMYAQVHRIA